MEANSSFESWKGGALDNTLRQVVPQSGGIWVKRAFGKREPAERRIKRKAIKVAKSWSRVRPERVGRRAKVVKYLEEVAKDGYVTSLGKRGKI